MPILAMGQSPIGGTIIMKASSAPNQTVNLVRNAKKGKAASADRVSPYTRRTYRLFFLWQWMGFIKCFRGRKLPSLDALCAPHYNENATLGIHTDYRRSSVFYKGILTMIKIGANSVLFGGFDIETAFGTSLGPAMTALSYLQSGECANISNSTIGRTRKTKFRN